MSLSSETETPHLAFELLKSQNEHLRRELTSKDALLASKDAVIAVQAEMLSETRARLSAARDEPALGLGRHISGNAAVPCTYQSGSAPLLSRLLNRRPFCSRFSPCWADVTTTSQPVYHDDGAAVTLRSVAQFVELTGPQPS